MSQNTSSAVMAQRHEAHDLTQARLRTRLHYDPCTGIFTWLSPKRGSLVGRTAGNSTRRGYVQINFSSRLYKAHRLAWFYVHGAWPRGDIDHINGDKADNRITNLREATRSQNMVNTGRQRNNSSGFKGVCFARYTGRWRARLKVNGRDIHLGYFNSPEEAAAAYRIAAHEHFGVFTGLGHE